MLTLSVTACDKKKTDTEPLPEEVTEETVESTEPVYIEAADEDFVDIDFNISIIDDEPPVKMNVADLSGVDFGERLTPCKTESEYRDRYGYTARFGDPEMQAEYERLYEVFCNTPSAGHIESVAFIDDKFYFAVNYDDFCSRHDSSLFSFDPKSGEYKELDRRSGMEYNGCYAGLISCGGRLFFYDRPERMHEDDPENSTVYVLDPKTAEISEFIKVDYSIYWMEDTANGLYVSGSVANAETEENSWRFAYYDPETGLKLDYSEEPKYARFWGTCDGVPVEVSGGIDWSNGEETDEPVTIKTQYYTIKTDFKRVDNVLAWKDRLSVLVNGAHEDESQRLRRKLCQGRRGLLCTCRVVGLFCRHERILSVAGADILLHAKDRHSLPHGKGQRLPDRNSSGGRHDVHHQQPEGSAGGPALLDRNVLE